jgi:hypothetical protein
VNGGRPDERTPLLRSNSGNATGQSENEHAIEDYDIQAIAEVGQGALQPGEFPELGKRRSYSHSHWLAPDDDANVRDEPDLRVKFEENGLLSGISKTQFRFIFGGILLGYFVSQKLLLSFYPKTFKFEY